MPVRKIPKNHVSVTGQHATLKSKSDAAFESLVERDYMILLDFDPTVDHYEVQPVRIPVPGVPRGYVPDFLVHFLPEADGTVRPSQLTETKTTEDFERNASLYAPKFAAAERYANERGWQFVRVAAEAIRGPRLTNLKFLLKFITRKPDADDRKAVIEALGELGESSVHTELLASLAPTIEQQATYLPALWHLIAVQDIQADLDAPFAGGSPIKIWLNEEAT